MARGRPLHRSGAMPNAMPNHVEQEEGNDHSMREPPPDWPPISIARNSSSAGSLLSDNQHEQYGCMHVCCLHVLLVCCSRFLVSLFIFHFR